MPDPNESAVLLIEDLLDAQERLADEERALVRAQVAYALSWVQLRKAMGILLRFDQLGRQELDVPSKPAPSNSIEGGVGPSALLPSNHNGATR